MKVETIFDDIRREGESPPPPVTLTPPPALYRGHTAATWFQRYQEELQLLKELRQDILQAEKQLSHAKRGKREACDSAANLKEKLQYEMHTRKQTERELRDLHKQQSALSSQLALREEEILLFGRQFDRHLRQRPHHPCR